MDWKTHPAYSSLIAKATRSHANNRNPSDISDADVARARLYAYAFRLHVIGAFHATRLAVAALDVADPVARVDRARAVETLEDLTNQAMETIPDDFRALLVSLYRYHRGLERTWESLTRLRDVTKRLDVARIADLFRAALEPIVAGNGIHVVQDLAAPEQAHFVVPGLGIIIVPLVYGDHHSWNLAYLTEGARNVPTHRHHRGVEIHLGYNPTHGMTVLGNCRAQVDEGYAMPIPPETNHGWVNTAEETHHVPFIFGSKQNGGWGVFLDVEPQPQPVDSLRLVPRDSPAFSQMVYLERHIAKAEKIASNWRGVLIPASVTDRHGTGGIELSIGRANPQGLALPVDTYRIVSIVRGQGKISIEGIDRDVAPHDHFGIPAGMRARISQVGPSPLVLLDALLRKK